MFEHDTIHRHHAFGETPLRGGVAPLRHALARRDYIKTQRRRFRRAERGPKRMAPRWPGRLAVALRDLFETGRRAYAVRPNF